MNTSIVQNPPKKNSKLIDLKGKTFSSWKVLKRAPNKNGMTMWLCRCECGLIKEVYSQFLRNGESTRCYSCSGRRRSDKSRIIGRLTQKRLKEILYYNKCTGNFTSKVNSVGMKKNRPVGCLDLSQGYHRINLSGVLYRAHRLAWLYVYGYFPEDQIDHKNGIRNDNRIKNLREATPSCNKQNQCQNSNNTSGVIGVSLTDQNTWRALIELNQKGRYLGSYETKLDAALARLTFEVQCDQWRCNHRNIIVQQVLSLWPEFNLKSIE